MPYVHLQYPCFTKIMRKMLGSNSLFTKMFYHVHLLCHNKWSRLCFFSHRFCGDFLPLPLLFFSRWDKISKFCPIFVLHFTKKDVSQVMKIFFYFIYNALFLWDIQIFVISTSTLFLLSPLLEKMIIDVLQVYDAIMCVYWVLITNWYFEKQK